MSIRADDARIAKSDASPVEVAQGQLDKAHAELSITLDGLFDRLRPVRVNRDEMYGATEVANPVPPASEVCRRINDAVDRVRDMTISIRNVTDDLDI